MPAGHDDRDARQELDARRRRRPRRPTRGRAGAPAGRTTRRCDCCRRARSPIRPAAPRSGARGNALRRRRRAAGRRRGRNGGGSSRRRRWSPGSKPAASMAATIGVPSYLRISRTLSVTRSPMPVSTRTRPAGVSTTQAVQGLEQPVLVVDLVGDEAVPQEPWHRPEQRAGIGPERAGLDQRDARPAPEIRRPVAELARHDARATRCAGGSPARPAPAGSRGVLAVREVAVEGRGRRLRLALVLGAELRAAVRPIDRAATSGRS